jgi:hypothetical protein
MQQDSGARKERLHREFIAALALLDVQHREPDRWEEECLAYALGAMACGMYLVAEVELEAFRRAPAERPAEVLEALEAKPRRFNKAMLRHGLDYVRTHYGEPVEDEMDIPAVVAAGQREVQSSMGPFA